MRQRGGEAYSFLALATAYLTNKKAKKKKIVKDVIHQSSHLLLKSNLLLRNMNEKYDPVPISEAPVVESNRTAVRSPAKSEPLVPMYAKRWGWLNLGERYLIMAAFSPKTLQVKRGGGGRCLPYHMPHMP